MAGPNPDRVPSDARLAQDPRSVTTKRRHRPEHGAGRKGDAAIPQARHPGRGRPELPAQRRARGPDRPANGSR
jgi:hypothetical protein